MYHKSFALSVIKFANILLLLALIVGVLYLANEFGYKLHDLLGAVGVFSLAAVVPVGGRLEPDKEAVTQEIITRFFNGVWCEYDLMKVYADWQAGGDRSLALHKAFESLPDYNLRIAMEAAYKLLHEEL